MGLELKTRASLKKKGLIFSSTIRLPNVAAAILAGAKGTPLEAVCRMRELKAGKLFALDLHPLADPVYLELEGSEAVVNAQTSAVGPGFHAFLVACLDAAQKTLGLQWEWGPESDETQYMPDRNFEILQAQMAFFLNHVAISSLEVVAKDGATGMKIFMPTDFDPEAREGEILTPVGPITVETLQRWADADIDRQIENAAAFFAWWDEGFDAGFYRGLALHALWMECRWAPPLDEAERKAMQRTLAWCAEAQKRGAALPVPAEAIAELQELSVSNVPRPFGKREGLGYRRRMTKHRLTENWTMTLPGGFERLTEGEGDEAILFQTSLLDIRISISGGPRAAGEPRVPAGRPEVKTKELPIKDNPDHFAKGYMLRVSPTAQEDEVCLVTFAGARIMRDLADTLIEGLTYTAPGFDAKA